MMSIEHIFLRFVVTQSHPWMIIGIVMCLHWSWVLGPKGWWSKTINSLTAKYSIGATEDSHPISHDYFSLRLCLFSQSPRPWCRSISSYELTQNRSLHLSRRFLDRSVKVYNFFSRGNQILGSRLTMRPCAQTPPCPIRSGIGLEVSLPCLTWIKDWHKCLISLTMPYLDRDQHCGQFMDYGL
jgi:hypothetical protein